MQYFIAINGRAYADRIENKFIPRLDIENNLFDTRDEAWFVAHELEEQKPCIFYGKPTSKEGLRRYALGDTAATD